MSRAPKQTIPQKFEMLTAMKPRMRSKFEMGKSTKHAEPKKFEMLGNKAAGPSTGFLKTMEMKTCL